MQVETLLIAGDSCIDEIVSALSSLILGEPSENKYGFSWEDGLRFVGDADRTGDYYDNDFDLPLSRYRFEVSTQGSDGQEWMEKVFESLARTTNLDLLWLTDMQHLNRARTLEPVI